MYVYHSKSYKDIKNNNIVLNVIKYLELLKKEGLTGYEENVLCI